MCNCIDKTLVILPWNGNHVRIDSIILPTLKRMWIKGIITTKSCGGHNNKPGYIQVKGCESECKMILLGYKHAMCDCCNQFKQDTFKWNNKK